MIRKINLLLLVLVLIIPATTAHAFWVWTPETNKWVNPKYSVKETPQEQLAFALQAYEAGEYKEAIKEFQKLIKHYPRARQAPEAQFYISQCFENQGKLFTAFNKYQEVIDKYPFSERAPEIIEIQYQK